MSEPMTATEILERQRDFANEFNQKIQAIIDRDASRIVGRVIGWPNLLRTVAAFQPTR